MLTLQVASDLHLEFHADLGRSFIEAMDPAGVDVLVLAGDIMTARPLNSVRETLKRFADRYAQVIYVPGNHELWGSKSEGAITLLGNAAETLSNVSLLNNQVITCKGQRFLGGPMWFPQWSPLRDYVATQMEDFKQIVDFDSWVVAENRKFQKFAEENLKLGDVVLTHYLPSFKSVAPKYQGASTNEFFICEMDHLIQEKKPSLWIHGHTHESMDYQLFDTRIVCNPFGYPRQLNPAYQEKMLISVN